jgi:hypothetical protein
MAGSKKTSNVVVFNRLGRKKPFKKLSNDDLLAIIKTDDYAHLKGKFKPYLCSPERLFRHSPYKFYDRALEQSIEGSSAPLDGLFYLTCAVTLVGDTALGITTGAFGLTILYGLYNYYDNKKRSQEIKQDNIHYFQLAELRLKAADLFLTRMQKSIGSIETIIPAVVAESKPVSEAKSFCAKVMAVMPSIVKGGNTSLSILVGYYLSTVWLFEAIQLATVSAAMLTPVGLGIALGIALTAGIYCGYRYYKTTKANDFVADRKDSLSKEVQVKRDQCVELSGFKRGLFYPKNPSLEFTAAKVEMRPLKKVI